MANYLKSFVIGSSFPVLFPFFYSVSKMPQDSKNYSYVTYTFIAPLYLGLINMLAEWIGQRWNVSLRNRYLIIGPLSGLFVALLATLMNTYNYDRKEWASYYLRIIFIHFLIFNIVIYYIEFWLQ